MAVKCTIDQLLNPPGPMLCHIDGFILGYTNSCLAKFSLTVLKTKASISIIFIIIKYNDNDRKVHIYILYYLYYDNHNNRNIKY